MKAYAESKDLSDKEFSQKTMLLTQPSRRSSMSWLLSPLPRSVIKILSRLRKQHKYILEHPLTSDAISAWKFPTLLVSGGTSPACEESINRIVSLNKVAVHLSIKGKGHTTPQKVRKEFNTNLLDFVDSTIVFWFLNTSNDQ